MLRPPARWPDQLLAGPKSLAGRVSILQGPFGSNVWLRNTHREACAVTIQEFMQGYKTAWEQRAPSSFAALFHPDGEYHNTPFQVQRGAERLTEYWKRVQLQEDVRVTFEVLSSTPTSGIAHWHVTYRVASEELFQIWAKSTGTNLVARKPGDPLPRMVLDGIIQASFSAALCSEARIWWHSMPQPA